MKYWLAVLAICCPAFGAEHDLVLRLDRVETLTSLMNQYQVVAVRQLGHKPTFKVLIESGVDRQSLLARLQTLPGVLGAETNQALGVGEPESAMSVDSRAIFVLDELSYIDSRAIFVLDESAAEFAPLLSQYHVIQTRAIEAWQYGTGAGVVVAVLDTGVDFSHGFLQSNLLPGWDFVDDDGFPQEERPGLDSNENGVPDEGWGHGSHVAGIIRTIAPSARILPIRVADSDGQADLAAIVEGIAYAIQEGARVINLSMSIMEPSDLLREWLDVANRADVLVVTSAGNDNSSELMFPAGEFGVLTVASVGPGNVKSPFSNYSPTVDVSAPGESIVSCLPGNGYVKRSGTSMAAPIAAAEAAIIMSLKPSAGAGYTLHRIRNKSQSIDAFNPDYHHRLGRGLVDVLEALPLNRP